MSHNEEPAVASAPDASESATQRKKCCCKDPCSCKCKFAPIKPVFKCKDPWNRGANIIGILFCDGRFNTLLKALELTDLLDFVADAETLTLFAPTDDAFADLPSDTLAALFGDLDLFRQVLLYHMLSIGRTVVALTRAPPMAWETLQGTDVIVSLKCCETRTIVIDALDREATVIDQNLAGCNGVVQVINEVLLPFLVPVAP